MILDRDNAGLDPRKERKNMAKTQEEITSALNRVVHNTDPKNQERLPTQQKDGPGRFKNQGVRSVGLMRQFEKERKEQDEALRSKREEESMALGSRSRPQSTEMKVINFRDGLVIPITDHMDYQMKERMSYDLRLHRQSIFQLRMIDKKVQALIPKGGKTLGQRMREGFNDFMVAPIINTFKFIGKNILAPVISKVASSFYNVTKDTLFGLGKEERTTVKAIDEQTQFLRKGFIDRNRGLWDTIREGGLLGSAVKGGLGKIIGRSVSDAQRAEEKKSRGEQLSKNEEKAIKKQRENINLLSRNAEKNEDKAIQEQRNDILWSTFNILEIGMKTQVKTIGLINNTLMQIGSDIRQGINGLNDTFKSSFNVILGYLSGSGALSNNSFGMLEDMTKPLQTMVTQQMKMNSSQEDLVRAQTKNNEIQDSVLYETEKGNSPWMSPFEEEMINKFDEQSSILKESNEMQQESMKPEKKASGGLMGMVGMGVGWLGSKLASWLKTAVVTAGPKILAAVKSGFAIAAGKVALAGAIGWAIGTYIVNPFINKIDSYFGTDIGHAIGKATHFLVEGIKDLISSPMEYMGEVFSSLGTMLWEGIKGTGEWLVSKIKEVPVIGSFIEAPNQNPGNDGVASRRASGGGPGLPNTSPSDVEGMNKSAREANNDAKNAMEKQAGETKTLRERLEEQNERMIKVLEQINGNSAATAANSGGDTEEKVFLRKDQQFTFEGNPL